MRLNDGRTRSTIENKHCTVPAPARRRRFERFFQSPPQIKPLIHTKHETKAPQQLQLPASAFSFSARNSFPLLYTLRWGLGLS